jgi:hypothetical protein
MFASSPRASSALTPIAELLFAELQDFGRLGTGRTELIGDFPRYAQARVRPALRLLQLLEETADLRWNSTLPHSYAFGRWPEGVPIGGYTAGSAAPKPSLVLRAMIDHWEAAASGYSVYLRLLRSALFVAHSTGLPSAVEYLLDLHCAGEAPQADSTLRVIKTLLQARASVSNDEETVPFLMQGPPPTSTAGWQDTIKHLPEFSAQYSITDFPDTCNKILNSVLSRANREVDRIRHSQSFDRWVVGQINLHWLLFIALPLITHAYPEEIPTQNELLSRVREFANRVGVEPEKIMETLSISIEDTQANPLNEDLQIPSDHPKIPIQVRTILSRLEEIYSDAFAYLGSLQMVGRNMETIPSFWSEFVRYASSRSPGRLASEYMETFGQDWAKRLYSERLVIPACLGPEVFEAEQINLPEEWRIFSWKLAYPFTAVFRPDAPALMHRTSLFTSEELTTDEEVQGFFQRHNVQDQNTRHALTDIWYRYRGDQHPENLTTLAETEIDEFRKIIREAHFRLCTNEITLRSIYVQQKSREEEGSLAYVWLAMALSDYPWSDWLRFQLAFQLTARGELEEAKQELITALALFPEHSDGWILLGVVLDLLDCHEEADLTLLLANADFWK